MARGKQFEKDFSDSFGADCFCYRLIDSPGAWAGGKTRFTPSNICDFIMFENNISLFIELKSFTGKSIPFKNFRDKQINGLFEIERNRIGTLHGGFLLNFRDLSRTFFILADAFYAIKEASVRKSLSLQMAINSGVEISQKKKRVHFTYDIKEIFETCKKEY